MDSLLKFEQVVKAAERVRLVESAGLISTRVVKVDAANDLALLKAEGRLAALEFKLRLVREFAEDTLKRKLQP